MAKHYTDNERGLRELIVWLLKKDYAEQPASNLP